MFFVGALIGVVVPSYAGGASSPGVQRGVQVFLTFMTLMAAAVSGGLAAPAVFVGLLAGYTFAIQYNTRTEIEMMRTELKVMREGK